MKVLSIIFLFLMTIALFVLTIWQIVIESPTFVVCVFFVMCLMEFAILCQCFFEFYDKKK